MGQLNQSQRGDWQNGFILTIIIDPGLVGFETHAFQISAAEPADWGNK